MTNSIFRRLGATNHSEGKREENDYYATDPKAATLLMEVENFNKKIWECACGEKHLANEFEKNGYNVRCSDLIDRCGNEVLDFLSVENKEWNGDIITNPPYKYAEEFIEKSLQIIPKGNKVAMFLKLTFLEGKRRKKMFTENPPKTLYVSSSRINCYKNGDIQGCTKNSAIAYGWFVWEKGYKGDTIIKWIN